MEVSIEWSFATWSIWCTFDSRWSISEYLDYPAVHISYNDAKKYCKWAVSVGARPHGGWLSFAPHERLVVRLKLACLNWITVAPDPLTHLPTHTHPTTHTLAHGPFSSHGHLFTHWLNSSPSPLFPGQASADGDRVGVRRPRRLRPGYVREWVSEWGREGGGEWMWVIWWVIDWLIDWSSEWVSEWVSGCDCWEQI